MSHYWKADKYYRYKTELSPGIPSSQKSSTEGISWQKLCNDKIVASLIEGETPMLYVKCNIDETPEPIILEELNLCKDAINEGNTEILHDGTFFGVRFLSGTENSVERRFILILRNAEDSKSFSFIVGQYIKINKISDQDVDVRKDLQLKTSQDTFSCFITSSQPPSNDSTDKPEVTKNYPGPTRNERPDSRAGGHVSRKKMTGRNDPSHTRHFASTQSISKNFSGDDNFTFDLNSTSASDLRNLFLKAVMSNEFRYLIDEVSRYFAATPKNKKKRKRASTG